MGPIIGLAIAVLGLITAILLVLQVWGADLSNYELGEDGIEFVLFGSVRVWTIPYKDVLSIEPVSLGKALFTALPFTTRPLAQHVLLTRKSGRFRSVLIAPDHPDDFVAAVRTISRPAPARRSR